MSDGSVSIKVELDSSGVERGVKNVKTSLSGIKSPEVDGIAAKAKGMGKQFALAGAAGGAMSVAVSKAIGAVSSSLDGAIKRVDTIRNFPRVMESLGYSSADAEKDITKMADSLDGLPTATNELVASVQQITASLGDLDQATDLGIGLNDMMLAGGASTAQAASAIEMFNHMLASGKVYMGAWSSVVRTAPGQIDQLAKSILGAKANQHDLYAAMKSGKVTFDQFNAEIIKLDKNGGKGFASFAEQARSATKGIETSWQNVQTAITKNVANVIDSIGQENIAGFFDEIKGSVNAAGKFVTSNMPAIIDTVKPLFEIVKSEAPKAAAGVATLVASIKGFSALKSVKAGVEGAAKSVAGFGEIMAVKGMEVAESGGKFGGAMTKVGTAMASVSAPAMVGAVALAAFAGVITRMLVKAASDYIKHAENMRAATTGLVNSQGAAKQYAEEAAGAWEGFGTTVSGAAQRITQSTGNLAAKQAEFANSAHETWDEYYTGTMTLNGYTQAIGELTAKQSLSAGEQARLKAAVDGYNQVTGDSVEVTGAAKGELSKSTEEILKNAAAWQENAKQQAYSQLLQENEKRKVENQQHLNELKSKAAEIEKKMYDAQAAGNTVDAEAHAKSLESIKQQIEDTQKLTDANEKYSKSLTEQMEVSAKATGELEKKISGYGKKSKKALKESGETAHGLAYKLQEAGVKAKDLDGIDTKKFAKMLKECGGDIDKLVEKIKGVGKQNAEVKFSETGYSDVMNKANDLMKLNGKSVSIKAYMSSAEYAAKRKKHAAGGVIPMHAAGGVVSGSIPRYAGGAVVTSAMLTNIGIVGEAGAEWIGSDGRNAHVVPIANRHFARPLAQMIAADMPKQGDTYIVNGVTVQEGSAAANAISTLVTELGIAERRG